MFSLHSLGFGDFALGVLRLGTIFHTLPTATSFATAFAAGSLGRPLQAELISACHNLCRDRIYERAIDCLGIPASPSIFNMNYYGFFGKLERAYILKESWCVCVRMCARVRLLSECRRIAW